MTTEEKKAAKVKQHLMQYKDGQCELEIPWEKRIWVLTWKLWYGRQNNDEYTQIIEVYINKDYVKILEKYLETENKKWYLPHLAVMKPDKE